MFIDESFDTTTAHLGGWESGAEVSARGYVEGVGVGGSRAIQMSGYFLDWGFFSISYGNPSVACNASATRANTLILGNCFWKEFCLTKFPTAVRNCRAFME